MAFDLSGLTPRQRDLFAEIAAKIGERQFWDAPETAAETLEIVAGFPEEEIRRAMLTSTMPKPWPGNLRRLLGDPGRPSNAAVAPDRFRYLDATPSLKMPPDLVLSCAVCGRNFTRKTEAAHKHPLAPGAPARPERWGCILCGTWYDDRASAQRCGRTHKADGLREQEFLALRARLHAERPAALR